MGPHVTVLNKTILARLGFFRDTIDAKHPASLTVAADQYHKKLHEICAAKNPSNPIACTNMPILIEISLAGTKPSRRKQVPCGSAIEGPQPRTGLSARNGTLRTIAAVHNEINHALAVVRSDFVNTFKCTVGHRINDLAH
jgi:hypothetical protein